MADFNERFSGSYYSPRGSSTNGRWYSHSGSMPDKEVISMGGATLNKADLIAQEYPRQDDPTAAHEGSKSTIPSKEFP